MVNADICLLHFYSIREQSKASVFDSGFITEQENQRKASSSSTEERTLSQNGGTACEVHALDETTQEADSTETLVANLLQESRDHSAERLDANLLQGSRDQEEGCCSASENPSPRRESENKCQNNADLMRIITSVLLEDNVDLEGFYFADDENSSDHTKRNLPPHKASANKLHSVHKVTANKLLSVASKSELARRERERLHLIRTKVNAAVLIQRWFRKWTSIRREYVERDMMLSDVKTEQVELNREVAALTIQLAWRKHVRLEFEKKSTRTKHQKSKKPMPNSASCKPKQNGIHSYGRSLQKGPPINYVNSRTGNKRRPAYMKYEPSPAAMSYNMAMDLYHPMGSRQGNSRAAMVTAGTRVRPGSMKRTENGWSHDVGFMTKMNGKMIVGKYFENYNPFKVILSK